MEQTKPKDGKLLAIGHSMGGILLYAMMSQYGRCMYIFLNCFFMDSHCKKYFIFSQIVFSRTLTSPPLPPFIQLVLVGILNWQLL